MSVSTQSSLHQRLNDAVAALPSSIQASVTAIVLNTEFRSVITKAQFQQLLNESGLPDRELRLAMLPLAAAYSVAPISNFYVGAIARGLSGNLYFGANMEILGLQLGQTVHAEQSAISYAWVNGETGISDMTINFSPCGHCRQFMNELSTASELTIQLPEREQKTLQAYLPESFGPSDLDITTPLMATVDHQLTCQSDHPLILAALTATNKSHAPYSHNVSGVAIETAEGQIFTGMYAENAAFNPSLPPLQVALVNMNMSGISFNNIRAVALVERANAAVSHLVDTQGTLEAINPDIQMEYLAL
jgi:cytidine deaminase